MMIDCIQTVSVQVLFYKNSSSIEEEQQRISAETQLLLEGLETFTFYFISVQAYNLAGEGPRSGLVSARTSEGGKYSWTLWWEPGGGGGGDMQQFSLCSHFGGG